jgi:hypothetical protein
MDWRFFMSGEYLLSPQMPFHHPMGACLANTILTAIFGKPSGSSGQTRTGPPIATTRVSRAACEMTASEQNYSGRSVCPRVWYLRALRFPLCASTPAANERAVLRREARLRSGHTVPSVFAVWTWHWICFRGRMRFVHDPCM